MADSDRIKLITDNLEATYNSLKSAYANISGLLSVERATCDEVKAYNLWALATYNAQRGMLAALRANGEDPAKIPALPPSPSLFAWQGQDGNDAINIDCTGQASSLSGALGAALQPTSPQTIYLGLDKIKIVTTDQHAFDPEKSPSFAQLLAVQDARATQGLGNPIVLLIVIASIVVGVSVAIQALMQYLDQSKLQEETTARTKLQADAFATYTAARLQCYQSCIGQGKTAEECVATCQNLVDKPNIDVSCVGPTCPSPSWGALQWIGFTVALGAASVVVYKVWDKKRRGLPLFEMPSFLPDLHLPGGD